MRRCGKYFETAAMLVAIARYCGAQQSEATQTNIDTKALRAIEDSVATQFANIRRAAGMPQLSRIKHRSQLRQMVCTASVRGGFGQAETLFYKTSDPTASNEQLERLAKFDTPKEHPRTTPTKGAKLERFAVAAWPSQTQGEYWVGVGLYLSAGWEWVDLHLTDDRYYGNQRKNRIASECKKVH
jgi:hypothetical protein